MGGETGAKDAEALREPLDGEYGRDIKVIQTDNGSSFRTGPFHDLLVERGIHHLLSSTSTPQSQGLAERNNATAKRWLYAMAKERFGNEATRKDGLTSWIKVVPEVEKAINETVQMSTKKRPIDLFHEEGTNQTVVDRMKALAAKRYDSRVYQEAKLKPGDKVYLSMRISARAPFFIRDAIAKKEWKVYKQQWDTSYGPYTVERPSGDKSYRLVELQGNYDRTDLLRAEG